MMKLKTLYILFAFIVLSLSVYFIVRYNNNQRISYNEHIRPIINSNCITCHGGVKKSAGLSFLFREEALGNTESGLPAIIPGDAKNSEMLKRIRHHDPEFRMPLEKKPLQEEEIKLITQWIEQGAEWENHWSFIPPNRNIEPPSVSGGVNNDIDRFVLSKLKVNDLEFAPKADKEILLRRLYLDLIGLPPTPDEASTFLNDNSSDAYEHLVDRLLDSPHFGEKWASMWLDLARYSDTKGYEKDLDRSIWKYRDWVINAFNEDMPYDQFTIEQLAGDLLPDPTKEQLIATAFHRNTMANDEGGTDNEEFRVAAVLERVGTTSEVWQGTTMACVQCHSHPYDPIRHEEFYELMAFFNNTVDRDIYNEQPKLFTYEEQEAEELTATIEWIKSNIKEKDASALPESKFLHEKKETLLYNLGYRKVEAEEFQASSKLIELMAPDQDVIWQIQDSSWIMFEDVDLTNIETIGFQCATAISGGYIEVRLDSLDGTRIGITEITTTGQWNRWSGTKPEPGLWKEFKTRISPTTGKRDVYYMFRQNKDLTQHLFHLDWVYYYEKDPARKGYNAEFNEQLVHLSEIQAVTTPITRDLPEGKSRTTRIFERGNWMTPGEPVEPDIPEIFGGLPASAPKNRLGLAQWLVSDDNPLTARVAVNRFWGELFGFGIIETMEEFGSQGSPPVNMELLDWLAVEFMDKYEWSMKRLLKEMVMTAAYQQSSHISPEKLEKDPRNRLISRGPRVRLSVEQIRDQILSVSGLINLEMYGPGIKPPRPDEYSSAWGSWEVSEGDQPYRRSVYIFGKRTIPFPMLTTFDATPRNVCTSRRIRTNTPLQALTMLNDTVFYMAAEKLGYYMAAAHPADVTECLKKGYERVMFRKADEVTLSALKNLYDEALGHYKKDKLVHAASMKEDNGHSIEAYTLVANAILNLDEFMTKN